MTYHINVKKTNIKEFLQIVKSLSSLGVIESYKSTEDLVREGEPLETDTLLNILANSKEEIKDGKLFSMKEVKDQIKSWKKR